MKSKVDSFEEGTKSKSLKKKCDKSEKKKHARLLDAIAKSLPAEEGEEDLSKESMILFSEINLKAVKIQSSETSTSQKESLIEEIISKLSGIIHQIVHKRDGSRAIQACMKHGKESQRDQIICILLDSKELDNIVKSKYGHFVGLRMIKLMKQKSHKDKFFNMLMKDAFLLVSHVEGSKVLD